MRKPYCPHPLLFSITLRLCVCLSGRRPSCCVARLQHKLAIVFLSVIFYSLFFWDSSPRRCIVPFSFLISPCQPNMIITLRNKRKSEASAGSGQAARGAEMDEASGARAPVHRLECSLLLKDGEIIVDGWECVPFLSQGSSYSGRILRRGGAELFAIFFLSVSRCSVHMQPGSRMHKQSRQMAESPRQVSPPVYSGGISKRDKLTQVIFSSFFSETSLEPGGLSARFAPWDKSMCTIPTTRSAGMDLAAIFLPSRSSSFQLNASTVHIWV